jgi:uncharacterized membrane protein required for colicin V production
MDYTAPDLFDLFTISVVSISSFLGFYRGATEIAIKLLGFVAAIALAITIYPYSKLFFASYIKNEWMKLTTSSIVAYIISLGLFSFIGSRILSLCKPLSRGFIDHMLGFSIGLARGVAITVILFCCIVIITGSTYLHSEVITDLVNNISADKYPLWLQESRTAPYLEIIAKKIVAFIPLEWVL